MMIVPPMPSHPKAVQGVKWTPEELQVIESYGQACIAAHKKNIGARLGAPRLHTPKYSQEVVQEIRKMIQEYGIGFKCVNNKFPMSERTFQDIKNHTGAYK